MTSADGYRAKASEFSTMAESDLSPERQVEYAKMAAAYLRLAEHAERIAENNAIFDPRLDRKSITP